MAAGDQGRAQAAKSNREWFALGQNIDVSLASEDGTTIAALQTALEDDRKLVLQGLMTQAEYDQEWYLSPEAAIQPGMPRTARVFSA
jgi:hypothetical protein